MEVEKSNLWLKILVSVLAVLILGSAGYFGYRYYQNKKNASLEGEKTAQDCSNLDTSSWKTYSEGALSYSIKYPADWQANRITTEAAELVKWYVIFGLKEDDNTVKIGGCVAPKEECKKALNVEITKEEKAKIDGKDATKWITSNQVIYYVPYGNVPYIFWGPAAGSSDFKNCEPEIYQKMLSTFKFLSAGGEGTGNSNGNETYNNLDFRFSFDYSSEWEIKDVYIYETAGGEKATVPTIIIGKKSDPKDAPTNQIWINQRQGSCQTEMATKSTDTSGSVTINIYQFGGENNWCAEVAVPGQDTNGKTVDYQFIAHYTDSSVKNVFKTIVGSFAIIK